MRYPTKSAIIGRMKRQSKDVDYHPCFISLFSVNDPHKSGKVPDKIVEFNAIDRIEINGLDINYLLGGNDLVVNELDYIEVDTDTNHRLHIWGKQTKKKMKKSA